MSRWWRAYEEAATDPKLQLLNDGLFRAWFNIMCIASKHKGQLPPLAHVAYTLQIKPDRAAQIITQLCGAGLLDKTETGFIPHNWNGRQYKSDVTDPTAAERMKRYRDGKRNDRNTTVTSLRPETETETETEQTLPTVAKTARAKKRAGPLPHDWVPSEKAYAIAEQFGQNVQIVEGIFRDYVASSGKLYADHDAAFHNFIRNQNNFNRGNGNGKAPNNQSNSLIAVLKRDLAALESEDGPDYALPDSNLRRISG